ncbi:hypothetical protein PGTUg99_050136 [Puccinia graminis f. sp. tritici]|nr:hypothetical protein PGTUg99_050140 [Puccinia graminis f. sp. tritici]KAA1136781.1 hypothetical protein PGTUg99_050136 [Puccinia graminis f. sp. tritici]
MDNPTKVRQATHKLEAEVLGEYARMAGLLDRVYFDFHSQSTYVLIKKSWCPKTQTLHQVANSADKHSTLSPYLLEGLLPLEEDGIGFNSIH